MDCRKFDGEGARTSGCDGKKEDRHHARARNQMERKLC